MSEMMKSFAMQGIGRVGVMEKPIPRVGPNDAIIRTTVALVCTSDVHTVAGAIGNPDRLRCGFGGDATQPIVPEASFDIAFLATTLGEIFDRAAALAQCFRALKSGGNGRTVRG